MASGLFNFWLKIKFSRTFSFNYCYVKKRNGEDNERKPIIILNDHRWIFDGKRKALEAVWNLYMLRITLKYNQKNKFSASVRGSMNRIFAAMEGSKYIYIEGGINANIETL